MKHTKRVNQFVVGMVRIAILLGLTTFGISVVMAFNYEAADRTKILLIGLGLGFAVFAILSLWSAFFGLLVELSENVFQCRTHLETILQGGVPDDSNTTPDNQGSADDDIKLPET